MTRLPLSRAKLEESIAEVESWIGDLKPRSELRARLEERLRKLKNERIRRDTRFRSRKRAAA